MAENIDERIKQRFQPYFIEGGEIERYPAVYVLTPKELDDLIKEIIKAIGSSTQDAEGI